MALAELPGSTPPATALLSNCGSGACGSDFGNILIFLWRITADTDRADDFPFEHNRNATLQGVAPGKASAATRPSRT